MGFKFGANSMMDGDMAIRHEDVPTTRGHNGIGLSFVVYPAAEPHMFLARLSIEEPGCTYI